MSEQKKTAAPKEPKKKEFFLFRWIMRLIYPNREMDIYAEEQLQSPMRLVVRNFFSKPMSVVSLILLIAIALLVFIAPNFVILDLGEQDSTLISVSPGFGMMKYPSALEKNGIADISVGNNYAVGADSNGKVYVWGKTRVSSVINLAEIPEEVLEAKIVKVSAGSDFVLALDERGTVYGWGNNRLQQLNLPDEIDSNNRMHGFGIEEIHASDQFSAALGDDGTVYLWGNGNFVDLSFRDELKGQVKSVALTNNAYVVLTKDGAVKCANDNANTSVTKIPEGLESGVVSITASSNCIAALKEDGTVKVWGAYTKGEEKIPEFPSKVVEIEGGRYHFVARCEDGSIIGWGSNRYQQLDVPEAAVNQKIDKIYSGSFQNYALTENGELITWGLKGFLLGTDTLGRDVFARLVNGGKMTMTIGAISVIIETIIGIILGGVAGYFGGVVDMVIMRIAEVVSSLPFIPFCMILSAVIGTRITVEQRMYLIMVILGILSWPGICRLVRAQMFAQREMEYVVAAKALGVKESKIIFGHIIPNVMSVCLVSITLAFGTAMLTESTLSYLGFGVPLPTPTWGNMLSNANNSIIIQNYWWNWVFVGAVFGIACICINLIGDGLRDALDPKANGR